ncbi:DUF6415 family natural product biosynthesis protein [Streptomyces sp. PA5.6]|uniref:DUF6415 family natural product biosynthesis protein n=1 Tax=Streptomyces sp. PA5.6 TaxID=3035651 RepID=UPI00390491DD
MTALHARGAGVPWAPPLDVQALRLFRDRLRGWSPRTPVDLETVYNDLNETLGEQSPPQDGLLALTERLRGHGRMLSEAAVADPHYPPPDTVTAVIERGCLLFDEPAPAVGKPRVGFAWRLALVTSDLAEGLLDAHCIKDEH